MHHVCIVRRDLPRGTLAAMLIHAAGESSGSVPPGTHAVALAAEDETHLERIERRLIFERIPHVAIREPDPPWCGALMAIGLPPALRRSLPSLLNQLSLLE